MFLIPPIGMTKRATVAPAAGVTFVDSVGWFQQQTSGNLAVTMPGTVQEGDLLIALGSSGAAIGTCTVDGPDSGGWTAFGPQTASNDEFEAFWKFAGSSEGNYNMQFTGGTSPYRDTSLMVFRNAGPPILEDSGTAPTPTSTELDLSWTDPDDGSFELVAGCGSYALTGEDITDISPGSFTNDILDDSSGASSGLMWSSYRASADAGTINYAMTFSHAMTYTLYNRIRIPLKGVKFVASARADNTGSNTLTITKPTGVVEGDVMLAAVVQQSVNSFGNWTIPSGWTEHYDQSSVIGDGGGDTAVAFYSKVAGASEPASYDWDTSETMRGKHGIIVAYRGADSSFDVTPSMDLTTTSSPSTSHTIAGITTVAEPATMVFAVVHQDAGSDTQTQPSPPTGMTERYWENNPQRTRHALGFYDEEIKSAGATGTRAMTTNESGGMVVMRLALKEAS